MAGRRNSRRKAAVRNTLRLEEIVRKYQLKQSKLGHDFVPARLVQGKSRWYVEFWVWDVQEEKLVRKRVGVGRASSEAERKRKGLLLVQQLNAMLEEGLVIDPKEAATEEETVPEMTVGEALGTMAQMKGAAGRERTRHAYDSFMRIFEGWARTEKVWDRPISQFQRKHVHRFLDFLLTERGLGNKSYNNYLGFLKALLNALVSRELIGKSPARGIKMLKTQSESHRVYTPSQQATLEAWLEEHDPRLFLFTRLIYFAFIRPIELMSLKAGQIDLRNRVILITTEQSKTAKQQGIYVVDPLLEVLQQARVDRLHPSELLFSKQLEPGSVKWHRNRVSERHKRALEKTGLYDGKHTLYSWKHTGACNAYRAGVDIKTLQALLRHHSLDMTAIYLRSLGLQLDENLKGKSW